ncbi:MAG: sodium:solute symporter [Aureispira sp.]|nr:sodium:solute symporter [Aureispira sp.]
MNPADLAPSTSLSPMLLLCIVGGYFALLMLIAHFTNDGSSNSSFFTASKQSPWYVVAFGMVGASLSGVTFISVPGMVGVELLDASKAGAPNSEFSYMQMVLGYMVGYAVIALVLMPVYYKLNLTSIYTYLEKRFGAASYKTGAGFFLLSRIVGASFRLYLVAMVLQLFMFDAWGIPFWVTVLLTIGLIWLYTFRGGIKTIVWTDTLQTTFMLIAVVMTIVYILGDMGYGIGESYSRVQEAGIGQIFFFEGGWSDSNNFFKQFIAGAFIAIVMTGLDQDMMQKNLTCRTLKDAQKNIFSFSLVLLIVNFIFLLLGALLAMYAIQNGLGSIPSDRLYPTLALQYLPPFIGVVFIIGLVAAAYSSADSALTSLTTSFCVDFLGFKTNVSATQNTTINEELLDDVLPKNAEDEKDSKQTRYLVHLGFSVILFIVIVAFWLINDRSVINQLFRFAGYTYGPLLGLYAFGLFTKIQVKDQFIPAVCILAPILTFIINTYSETLLFGYKFGFELLLLNGLITFLGLLASKK